MTETSSIDDRSEKAITAGKRSTLATGLIILGATAGLFVLWQMTASLLVIFAGVLFASFLDACARALNPVLPVSHAWRLTLVVLILTVLIVLFATWGAGQLPEQTRYLIRTIDAQLDILQQRLLTFGVDLLGPEGGRDFSSWFSDHGRLFGHAQTALGTASGILANTVVILFLGILFASSLHSHLTSIVKALCCS